MGIEIPEIYGGATFFHAVLAIEALSRVDPSVAVLVDVQNTLVAKDDRQTRYQVSAESISHRNS